MVDMKFENGDEVFFFSIESFEGTRVRVSPNKRNYIFPVIKKGKIQRINDFEGIFDVSLLEDNSFIFVLTEDEIFTDQEKGIEVFNMMYQQSFEND